MDGLFHNLVEEKSVDFGKQSKDYGKFRPGVPDDHYCRLQSYLPDKSWKGLTVLDIGCGPGVASLRLAQMPDHPNSIVGVDIAENQINEAIALSKEMKVDKFCRFHVGSAEKTQEPNEAFDAIIAMQCWPWFKQPEAMQELTRILKPGGLLFVVQYCYLPKRSMVAKETEDLILQVNPTWKMANGDGLYPSQIDQLVVEGGFEFVEQSSYDHLQEFTHEGWRGRIRTCNGVGSGVLSEAKIKEFDKMLANHLKVNYADPLKIWHRIWTVIVRKENKLQSTTNFRQSRSGFKIPAPSISIKPRL